jgi:hypothetical protein
VTDERTPQGTAFHDWTASEVDAAVEAYFAIWTDWLNGQRINKAERVRALMQTVPARSRGSIEYKFQNISAVTSVRLSNVWLEGYLPAKNYQADLVRSVEAWLSVNPRLEEVLDAHRSNALPAPMLTPKATEDLLVEVPTRGLRKSPIGPGLTTGRLGAIDDFRLRELGRNGEDLVWRIERESLKRAGRSDLADKVRWVATETAGLALGYDIASFDHDGAPKHIEVKTTNFGISTPFYITRNEVDVWRGEPSVYSLYRVFNFQRDPRLYRLEGAVDEVATLDP